MSSLEPISSSDDIGNFLDFLYGESEGYVYVPTREQNRGAWKQEFFHWPEQKQQIENYIRLNTGDREVYIAPAMFSEKSSLKEAFLRSHVVWAELDGKSPVLNDVPQPTLKVQTSSHHHEHWYWKLTEPITSKSELEQINGSLTYSLGADVSGWDCNQVLRPPSTINHKRSRATSLLYRGDSEYSPLSFTHLKPGPIATTEIDQTTIPDVTTVILKYAFNEQSISQFRASPAEGERSTALMSLGHLCAEMGMTDGEIFSVVRNADDRWGKFKDRTDRNKRLSDLIARVRLKHPYLNADDNQKRLDLYGFKAFMETNIVVEWLIPGLLQRAGYFLLTGPSGVGKTQWSLQWAIHLALGKPYLSHEISEPAKIIFFSLEMGHADLKYFLSTMSTKFSQDDIALLEKNLLIVPLGEPLHLDGQVDQKIVENVINTYKPDGIFVDSIGSSTEEELNGSTVKSLMGWNDKIRQRYGIFTWYIHHNRKAQADNKKPNKLSDVYGGQYLVNRATSVYCLWPAKPSTPNDIEVIELKVRLKERSPSYFIQRTKDLNFIRISNVNFYQRTGSVTDLIPDQRIKLEYKAPETPEQAVIEINEEGFVSDVKHKKDPPPTGPMRGTF